MLVLLVITSTFHVSVAKDEMTISSPFVPACIAHHRSTEQCKLSAMSAHFSAQCESPCVDGESEMIHFDQCQNIFHYTWQSDPPPCEPVKVRRLFGRGDPENIDSFKVRLFKNV